MNLIDDLPSLLGVCTELLEGDKNLTQRERGLLRPSSPEVNVDLVIREIRQGKDPLGESLISIRSAEERRSLGQVFTPKSLVDAIAKWSCLYDDVDTIIDPGSGSGRFAFAALEAHPKAHVIAYDVDPVATLMLRANARVLGVAQRIEVRNDDYCTTSPSTIQAHGGRTLFVSNPPYVRHHGIDKAHKDHFVETASRFGIKASRLSGMHAHFLFATAEFVRRGDMGAFLTSAEWLDANYGKAMRDLLCDVLGITSLHIIDPRMSVFKDIATTAGIVCFEVGNTSKQVLVEKVSDSTDLGALNKGTPVDRKKLKALARWGIIESASKKARPGYVELGELARVHRGTATGANKIWIVPKDTTSVPKTVLYPAITKARELFSAGERLSTASELKCVVDIPRDLSVFGHEERLQVDAFLSWAKERGAADGYIARTRKCWWNVGLAKPAPILTTYMARRSPAFVRNDAQVRHLNIAHGIYPSVAMSNQDLDALARYLSRSATMQDGRTYAGGLTKFEPREVERLIVPDMNHLRDWMSV